MSEIRVDTISEKTSANGVAVDSLAIKDGKITNLMNATLNAADLGTGIHIKTADSGATANSNHSEIVIEGSGHSGMSILSGTSNNGVVCFGDSGNNCIGYLKYDHSDNALVFGGNTAERMRITSDGNVLIGQTSTPASNAGLGIASTASGDSASMYLDTYAANQSQSTFFIRASKNNTVGTKSETSSGQDLGSIYFQGVNSSSAFGYGANITATQTGAAGSSKIPTALIFGTATNSALAERMRITDAGLHIGGTGSANALDDYEEGTWTIPTGAVNGITYVVAGTLGVTYTKVGRNVTVFGQVGFGASTSDNNATYFGTLPFAAASNGVFVGKVQTTAGVTGACVELNGGENFLRLMKDSGGSYDYITRAESRNKTFAFTITYHV
tara:strand:- start:46 stop:1200 length:1155 start_codon:yes stop_codon:yes gene_type:complete